MSKARGLRAARIGEVKRVESGYGETDASVRRVFGMGADGSSSGER